MQRLALRVGLLALAGLALATTTFNVEAQLKAYRVGEAMREADDLRQIISFRLAFCRRSLSTDRLLALSERLGISTDELFPALPATDWPSMLALGSP